MSLKQELETWVEAMMYYDNNEFEEALHKFEFIAETSKIWFNCGIIHATLGAHPRAVECYQKAVKLDQYLAVAYFQQGVSNFLMGEFEEAAANFNDALLYLRGNLFIDYEQLGLKFKLYSCEVLFNRGLCYVYLQQNELGMNDLRFASKEKQEPTHSVIEEAIGDEAQGYMVFSIQVGTIYRPNESKIKNLKTKDYLGKARLVASAEAGSHGNATSGEGRRNVLLEQIARDERAPETISYGATNLIDPRLRSRSTRQQSEPPLHRQVFPPTPPPEERTPPLTSNSAVTTSSSSTINPVNAAAANRPPRAASRGPRGKPEALNLVHSNIVKSPTDSLHPPAAPRRGTVRTSSEPRTPSSRQFGSGSHTRSRSKDRSTRETPLIHATNASDIPDHHEPRHSRESHGSDDHHRSMRSQHLGPPSSTSTSHDRFSSASQDSFRLQRPMSGNSTRSTGRSGRSSQHPTHSRFIQDRHQSILEEDEEEEGYNGDARSQHGGSVAGVGHRQRKYSNNSNNSRRRGFEDSSSQGGGYDSEENLTDFEVMSPMSPPPNMLPSKSPVAKLRPPPEQRRTGSRRPEVRKINLKIHHNDETRKLVVTPTADFSDLRHKIQEKLELGESRFKIRFKDDGDMVTMGDQDDLDLALAAAKTEARKEMLDQGRLEVWVTLVA